MLLALLDNHRIEPEPGCRATCPFCRTPVTAKCGSIKAWHWAHLEGSCDSWLAPDTEWTTKWKSFFHPSQWEVLHNGRVADIKTFIRVVELVQLGLTPSQITEREAVFSPMIWLVDARAARIDTQPDPEGFIRFTWRKPKTNWLHATAPVLLDIGDELLQVRKMRSAKSNTIRGWGRIWHPTNSNPLPPTPRPT